MRVTKLYFGFYWLVDLRVLKDKRYKRLLAVMGGFVVISFFDRFSIEKLNLFGYNLWYNDSSKLEKKLGYSNLAEVDSDRNIEKSIKIP